MKEDIYKYPSAVIQEVRAATIGDSIEVEKIEFGNGIRLYFKSHPYPKQGIATADALVAISQIKRIFINILRMFHVFIIFVPLKKFIMCFNSMTSRVMGPHVLKPEYQTDFTKELNKCITVFLLEYDILDSVYIDGPINLFAETISHIFEYDGAYRMRFQDLFSETTKEKLISRKEIRRLVNMSRERDFKVNSRDPSLKFKLFANIFLIALYIPRIRRAYLKTISQMDLSKLQFDEGEKYWALLRKDYNIMGKSYEERQEILKTYQSFVV